MDSQQMIIDHIAHLRSTFNQGRTKPLPWRMNQLRALAKMIRDNEETLYRAVKVDLGKPKNEALTAEILTVQTEIREAMDELKDWIKPTAVRTPFVFRPGISQVYHDPLGVVLIIGAWNYPIQLVLSGLIGAIAAGNCVVLKPSELASETSKALAKLISAYLDHDAIRVIEGGVDETTVVLEQRFDHILYTGNARVARIVMAAAARHLTPVTLELGGKSPCYIDRSADLAQAARRIAWGKFNNAGQTCIAPDYVLIEESVHDEFVRRLLDTIKRFYGSTPADSPDYGRIINARHHRRLMALMASGHAATGGTGDADTLYIAPTVLTGVSHDSPVMAEEIFGPILPVLKVDGLDDAITFINDRPKPLALYMFSENKGFIESMLTRTSSGGVCINHVMIQFGVGTLPFGGVGESGMGGYHGKASFETFSHQKSVLKDPFLIDLPIIYPPYKEKNLKWLRRLI
ncbi:MAG: aldehyde dehydrogenase family protein [Myxococcota bacterium]|nr:aldehyde dehydrogenase family protein [Myxococcota bacterium]